MSRTLWRFVDRSVLPSEHIEAKVMELLRKGILTNRQTVNGQGQELVMTELNPVHPLVQEALPGFDGHNFDFAVPQEYEDGDLDGYGPGADDAFEDDNRGNLLSPGEVRPSRP